MQILRQSVANLWTTQFSLDSHKTWGGVWVVIAISSNNGFCFNQLILFSWCIEWDGWLMTWLVLSCNSQSYDDLRWALSLTLWGRPSQFVEAWNSSVKGVTCESRLQQIAHTVKSTKLANMITLKRSLITQIQKLVTAYTRRQVRIVSFNFGDNYNIKQNTTMNVNRSQNMGLYYIISVKQNQGWYI